MVTVKSVIEGKMNEAFQNEQAAKIIDALSKLRYKL